MIDLPRFVEAARPVTLARCAGGYLPWLMADVARAAKGRAWFIAADEAQARSVAEAAAYFAPEIAITMLPAWDCLPYDRVSPNPEILARRMATLAARPPELLKVGANFGAKIVCSNVFIAGRDGQTVLNFRADPDVAELAKVKAVVEPLVK